LTGLGWSDPQGAATVTILLRHGDTRLSPEHRFSGLSDVPLSADGARQVRAAAHRLACGAPIDAIVTSPLRRAAATAAIMRSDPMAMIRSTSRSAMGGSPSCPIA